MHRYRVESGPQDLKVARLQILYNPTVICTVGYLPHARAVFTSAPLPFGIAVRASVVLPGSLKPTRLARCLICELSTCVWMAPARFCRRGRMAGASSRDG